MIERTNDMAEATDTVTSREHADTHIGLNPVLKAVLEGVYQEKCHFSKLRGTPHILHNIWFMVISFWKSLIKPPIEHDDDVYPEGVTLGDDVHIEYGYMNNVSSNIKFPQPSGININMMPFIMADDFKDTKLPDYLCDYFTNIIQECVWDNYSQLGEIGYLSIHESVSVDGSPQRRPGIHTENPGRIGITEQKDPVKGRGQHDLVYYEHHWGNGIIMNSIKTIGGIYMGSNVANSCRVWDYKIMSGDNGAEIIGKHIEHLREFLDEGEVMDPNTVYWITDRTPHESLPLPKGTSRQWFRLVTSQVSLWFEDHSTKNPLGVVPDPNITTIIKGNKFDETSLKALRLD